MCFLYVCAPLAFGVMMLLLLMMLIIFIIIIASFRAIAKNAEAINSAQVYR